MVRKKNTTTKDRERAYKKHLKNPNPPGQVAHQIHAQTRNTQPIGAATHASTPEHTLYTNEKFLQDKNDNNSELDELKPRKLIPRAEDYTESHAEVLALNLLEYSLLETNRDFIGFVKKMGIPYTAFFELRRKYEVLRNAYEMAMVNFLHNNKKWLEEKAPTHAANLVQIFCSKNDPFMKEAVREEQLSHEKVRLQALEELVKQKEKLTEEKLVRVISDY